MVNNEHLSKDGFAKIANIAYKMNGLGKYRKVTLKDILNFLGSSETIR